jgi:hypothetical protein
LKEDGHTAVNLKGTEFDNGWNPVEARCFSEMECCELSNEI